LFGTTGAAKGLLESRIGADALIGLYQPVSAGENGDEGVHQLLGRGEFDCLLGNPDFLEDGLQKADLSDFDADSHQSGSGGESAVLLMSIVGRRHGDRPPVCEIGTPYLHTICHPFRQARQGIRPLIWAKIG
jgi:hypothetical protein